MRGQTNLIALAAALVLLTTATVVGVALADVALNDATRTPVERRAALGTADRLVAASAPTTVRANAMDAAAVDDLTAARLESLAPVIRGRAVRVSLDGETLVERGAPSDGVTVRRAVVVVTRGEAVRVERNVTDAANASGVRVPRGVGRATVAVRPQGNGTLDVVRADDRVVLYDEEGLNTTATVRVGRYAPTTLRAGGNGEANASGAFAVQYRPVRTHEATLTVTVDA